MDGLFSLSSPRASDTTATYAYKRSARSTSQSPRPSPVSGLSPRPPPARQSPRKPSHGPLHTTPRGRAAENFRSVSVLGEIVRIESVNSQSSMGPEEAFRLLQRLMPQLQGQLPGGLTHQQLLDGLESACWRVFSSSHPPPMTCNQQHAGASAKPGDLPIAVRYVQLYHGIMESIHDKHIAIQRLEGKIRETTAHTNELPRHIRSREHEIAKTIASFVALSAASLDCAVQRNRTEFGKNLLKLNVDQKLLVEKVKDRIATLRRRKDLRLWACNELRSTINDHLTRASELKKEITVVLSEVKKEELVHKVKTKRMEDAMVGMVSAPNGRKNSMMSGTTATRVLASGGLAAVATAAHLPTATVESTVALNERLSIAHERRYELLEEIAKRQEQVRKQTEVIFDVRNEVKALEAQKADIEAETEALEVELTHVQRSCTPRPDWEELQRAVAVTTAADLLGKNARMSLQSRERRGQRAELDVDDEEFTARQLKAILTSTWTTVEKVDALAQELARIRTKYHGGEELTTEKAKLEQLQKEIQKTLDQLATVRSTVSRAGSPSRNGTASRPDTTSE